MPVHPGGLGAAKYRYEISWGEIGQREISLREIG